MSITTSAPGNVFFFGEHSVVYQRWAMPASINKRTYSEIEQRQDERVIVESEDYGKIDTSLTNLANQNYESWEDYKEEMDPLRDLIGYFMREIKQPDHGFELKITSEIPKESGGMSSSTAVLCSVLKALDALFNREQIPKKKYFDYLYQFQVKIHGGAASGSEITSSSMGGYNKFKVNKAGDEAQSIYDNLGKQSYYLVIGDTGQESKTSKAVRTVRDKWKENPAEFETYFSEIEFIAMEGEKALLSSNVEKVGELMAENQLLLAEELGVSSPKLNQLINAAEAAGAYGAKLSGAGMGGIMIALVPEDKKEQVAQAIEKAGGNSVITEVGVEGARVEDRG